MSEFKKYFDDLTFDLVKAGTKAGTFEYKIAMFKNIGGLVNEIHHKLKIEFVDGEQIRYVDGVEDERVAAKAVEVAPEPEPSAAVEVAPKVSTEKPKAKPGRKPKGI